MVHPNAFTRGAEVERLVKGQLGLPSERDLVSTKQRESETQSKSTASVQCGDAPTRTVWCERVVAHHCHRHSHAQQKPFPPPSPQPSISLSATVGLLL